MSEVTDAVKAVFAQLGGFFFLFDPSFFVSGSVAVGAIWVWVRLAGGYLPIQLDGWLKVLAVILACYVVGLICFGIGRWMRIPKQVTKQVGFFDALMLGALKGHGLQSANGLKAYIDREDDRGVRRLYIRLWAEIRQRSDLEPSLLILNRYWVMAATYDGLATAVALWAVLFLVWTCGLGITPSLPIKIGIPIFILLVLCSIICLREAKRLVRAQVEELVATIAYQREKS